ncbi:map3k delta-1 protein kinase, putative [Entamoeba invadens IP1]|uniref:map3k delta-1 protein kinase, putative n=1 Tax=Entamoeba invadens IP1 TaxID=370355 RepID=UPI0002C3E32B|nr:map3k delta-1 protein kinase, putative [Entamoeba invadens IP1]ELP94003.1 map3k delta-1 protein kinase, putative [Entamoeba invadens IP1]|eukprot:XP_004260774.1 map3k delta-1 protein kinase, putative [Entamoeba invadens IP1]
MVKTEVLLFLLLTCSYSFSTVFNFSSTTATKECDIEKCKKINNQCFCSDTMECSNKEDSAMFKDLVFEFYLPPRAFINNQVIKLNVSTIFDLYSPPPKFALYVNNSPKPFVMSLDIWNDEEVACTQTKMILLNSLSNFGSILNGTNELRIVSYSNIFCVSRIEVNVSYDILNPVIKKINPPLGPTHGGTVVNLSAAFLYPEYEYMCCFGTDCVNLTKLTFGPINTGYDYDDMDVLEMTNKEIANRNDLEFGFGRCISPSGSNGSVVLNVSFADFDVERTYLNPNNASFTFYNLIIKDIDLTINAGECYAVVVVEGVVSSETSFCLMRSESSNETKKYRGSVYDASVLCRLEGFDLEQEVGNVYSFSVTINGLDYTDEVDYTVKQPGDVSNDKGFIVIVVFIIFGIVLIVVVIGFLIYNKLKNKTDDEEYISAEDVVLGDLLGSGSYGNVYSALWRGQEIAVKLIPTKDMLQDNVLQFTKEVQLMKKLRHPCVLQFFGSGTDANYILIAMELMSRGSAHTLLINSHLTMSWDRRLRMLKDAASGMFYLHSSTPPIIHRDLKSHNLLVDENWKVKVSDFGLSKTTVEASMPDEICGTLAWMAPEILMRKGQTTKSDVYSFAIVMWEFLARKEPYPDIPRFHLIEKVGEIGLRPDIPPNNHITYCELMQRCWEQDPNLRPDFSEIIHLLDDFIKEEPEQSVISDSPSIFEE